MSRSITIAIGSTKSHPGRPPQNLRQIRTFARRAAEDGAHLLLTPELSSTGYGGYPEVVALAESAGRGPIFDALAEIASESGLAISAGFVELVSSGNFHLSQYVVFPSGKFLVQRKYRVTDAESPLASCFPPSLSIWEDSPELMKAATFQIFELNSVRCVIAICADIGIPGLDCFLLRERIDLLLGPAGAGGKLSDTVDDAELLHPEGQKKYREYLERVFFPRDAVDKCLRNRRALAAVNLTGYDGRNHAHVGHGMVVSAWGEICALIPGQPNRDRQHPSYASATIQIPDAPCAATEL